MIIAKSITGDIGKAIRAKSLNLGNSISFLNLNFLSKTRKITNITPRIKDIKTMILSALIKNFKVTDYKKIHPGGTLGESMMQIKDIMYKGKKMPVVSLNASMKSVILEMSKKSFGHVGVKNNFGQLVGIISDGDLRRGFKKNLLNLDSVHNRHHNRRSHQFKR